MIKLKPSHIEIENYKTVKKLEYSLNLWNPATFSVDFSAMIKEDGSLLIPRGYNINKLLQHLDKNMDDIVDLSMSHSKYMSIRYNMISQPRDNIQERALDFLNERKEFDDLDNETQKILALKPGDGKTYCAINYISTVKKLPMVFVDLDRVAQQWKDSVLKFTDVTEDEIFIISGKETIEELMEIKYHDHDYKFIIAMHRTVSNFLTDKPNKFRDLMRNLGVGIKIYDEAHVEWMNIFYIDALTDISETLYLTATPERSDYKEDYIYQRMYETVVVHGLHIHDDERYHTVVYTKINTKPNVKQQASMVSGNYGFSANAFSDYLKDDKFEQFYGILFNIVNDMVLKSKPEENSNRVFIMIQKNDLIQKLYKKLDEDFESKNIGRFCGLVKRDKRDKELDKDIVITTVKSFNKAVHVDNVSALINTVPMSSSALLKQIIGRLRFRGEDKPSVYFDITDMGFDECKKQLTYKRRTLNKIAKEAFEIEL